MHEKCDAVEGSYEAKIGGRLSVVFKLADAGRDARPFAHVHSRYLHAILVREVLIIL